MDNLTDKALIIFPKYNTVTGAIKAWRECFYQALRKIPEVLKQEYNMDLYYLYTNKIPAIPDEIKTIIDVPKQDVAFLSSKNLITDDERTNTDYLDIKNDAVKKYPATRGADDTTRFNILEKRAKYIGLEIAKQFKVIIDFERPNNRHYNIRAAKYNDTRIILRVDYNMFKVTPEIGGEIYPPDAVLNRVWANQPIYNWPLQEKS